MRFLFWHRIDILISPMGRISEVFIGLQFALVVHVLDIM